MKKGYVYILTNKNNSVLYVGVTSDIVKRIYEHKNKFVDGFSRRYNLEKLVYFELYQNIEDAIIREKQLKKWNIAWKNRIIKGMNPKWDDLYNEISS
ncbi:GIY-YIG nuclease family protein [Francisella tularensis subsp. novicida]|uniref:GIY-YIG nuclease family protein n=1 Tax=Francisella tularensis TaxID=263 RepID=UPI0008FD5B53|nr:GIY-YIG nuclease family protein [Francisella tularensis]APC96061.1 GIY-YIG catalytic domain protein [Francisella tularensis subsp. novicida]MBK2345375.1 GIY-YIG nuclease family protein [Francisella tularensis subsp. novicida]